MTYLSRDEASVQCYAIIQLTRTLSSRVLRCKGCGLCELLFFCPQLPAQHAEQSMRPHGFTCKPSSCFEPFYPIN